MDITANFSLVSRSYQHKIPNEKHPATVQLFLQMRGKLR